MARNRPKQGTEIASDYTPICAPYVENFSECVVAPTRVR
jgi:hypothetical protein